MFTTRDPSLAIRLVAAHLLDLSAKKVTVVGGTDGLGRAIANLAAQRGAKVTVVGRTFRGDQGLEFIKADLSLVAEAERIGELIPADSDAVVLTTGILAPKERKVSAEGIEIDMAVSALSRHVILSKLAPRMLQRGEQGHGRVFVMGFPGSGQKGKLGDLNSERAYDGGVGQAHMNTVVANEALVHYWASKGLNAYGLNPGMIKTGIRANLYGGSTTGLVASVMEGLVGWFAPTPAKYAENIVPLLVAPELEGRRGAMFGQAGGAILASPDFKQDPEYAGKWIKELDELVGKAKASSKM